MAVLTGIVPSTERDAINTMLLSIGGSPIPDAVSVESAAAGYVDIQTTISVLKSSMREILTGNFRFNRQYGWELKPTTTYSWVDTTPATTVLNIFKLPSDILKWKLTNCQQNGGLDLILRTAEKYREGSVAPVIFYDRVKNRDGAEAARYPYLYLDTWRAVDFENLPETARKFITRRSARRYAAHMGFLDKVQFTAQDELMAWKELLQDQGDDPRPNMFNNPGTAEFFGGRPHGLLKTNRRVPRGGS